MTTVAPTLRIVRGDGALTTTASDGPTMEGQPAIRFFSRRRFAEAIGLTLICVLAGCHAAPKRRECPPPSPAQISVSQDVPRELAKVKLPAYRIEPPDILIVEALHVVPKPPYRLRTFDVVMIQVQNTLPDAPILGPFVLEPGGFVNLGTPYGRIQVGQKTVDEATQAITAHLRMFLADPIVSVALAELGSRQQIAGEHLVGPDGRVTLGSYGSVDVVGLTVDEAKRAIEGHLAHYLDQPEVSVDVFAFNSKSYYVITQGAGLGDRVVPLPFTGKETVLDAIANVDGLSEVSSKRIWVARPSPSFDGGDQILPVDWCAITQRGVTDTNYQLFPGDRVYVAQDHMVAFDTWIGKLVSPFERILGTTSLGTSTVRQIRFFNNSSGGFGFGF